jgi:hypothetical protein
MRTYLVSFTPATRTAHGFTSTISLLAGAKDHTVEAASFASLESEVRRLAHEFGQTCTAYVRLKDKRERNAPGFDAWDRKLGVIDYVAPEGASVGKLAVAAVVALLALAPMARAQPIPGMGGYQSQTYGSGYSVTTGPNGYRAETLQLSPDYSTTTVGKDHMTSDDLQHMLCRGSGQPGCD